MSHPEKNPQVSGSRKEGIPDDTPTVDEVFERAKQRNSGMMRSLRNGMAFQIGKEAAKQLIELLMDNT